MPIHTTNAELAGILADMEQIMNGSPALRFLFRTKINRFSDQNAVKIRSIKEGLDGLVKKYVKQDEKGHPTIVIDNNGRPTYVFHSDSDKELFDKERNDFLSQPCRIED